jgi:HEAT repeat protein
MNQILHWLTGGDKRSDGRAHEAAAFVLKHPEIIEDLWAGLDEAEGLIRGRAADALEKVARERPDLVRPYLGGLIHLGRVDPEVMVRMHVAMILGHLVPDGLELGRIEQGLVEMLDDPSALVKSWAVTGLCLLGRRCPARRPQIVAALLPLEGDGRSAVRTRARKGINLLTHENLPFPPGWVKRSDRL